jgi:hypothetical protein
LCDVLNICGLQDLISYGYREPIDLQFCPKFLYW